MPAMIKAERLLRLPERKPCNNRGMALKGFNKASLKNISSTQIPFAFKSFSIKLY
jgi:hypothetical protein